MRSAALAIGGCILGAVIVMSWHAMAPTEYDREDQANRPGPEQTLPEPPTSEPAEPTPPSLAEVAALGDDSKRNKALYELIAGLGQARVENLLDQTLDLPPSLHRHDIARILYVRLASIDPAAALLHLLGSRRQQHSLLTAVFRAWAHTDLDEAVRRAATLDAYQKVVVARTLFDMDMPAWQRQDIAERLDATTSLAQVLAREELASGTPEQAWANAVAHAPGPQRQQQLSIAIQAWATKDPEAALRAASGIGGDGSLHLSARVVAEWVKADRPAALNWLSRQDPSRRTRSLARTMARRLAEDGIADALEALEHIPGWARQDARQTILTRWLTVDPVAAITWIGSLSLADQETLSSTVAHEYSNRDPRGAFNWAMTADPRIRERLLRSVLIFIDDATVAEQLFRSIDDPVLRGNLAHALFLAHGAGEPVDALRWAATFQADVHDQLSSHIFRNWAKTDPDAAVREVLRQRNPAVRDRAATHVISGLLDAFNAADAERLFQAMDSIEAREEAARELYLYFLRTEDPDKADYYLAIWQAGMSRGR